MIWGICDGKKMNAWMIGGKKRFYFILKSAVSAVVQIWLIPPSLEII